MISRYCAQFVAAGRGDTWQPDAYFDDPGRAVTYVKMQLLSNCNVALGRVVDSVTNQVIEIPFSLKKDTTTSQAGQQPTKRG